MTLHISLPQELETMVQHEVARGLYGDAQELVREALRCFFSHESTLPPQQLSWLREELSRRREGLQTGAECWVDGADFFAQMEAKYN